MWGVPVVVLCAFLSCSVGCNFACFLSRLRVDVPDVQFDGHLLLKAYHVSFSHMTCDGFHVANVSSKTVVGARDEVLLRAEGLGFVCSGQWNASWLLHGHGTLEGSGEGSFEALQELISDGVITPHCEAVAACNVTLTGTAWIRDLFELLRSDLKSHISRELERKMCSFVQMADQEYLSVLVKDLNAKIAAPVNAPAEPLLPAGTQVSSLLNSTVVGLLDFVLRRVFGPNGLNRVFSVVNISSITLDLDLAANFPLSNMSSLSIMLDMLTISGKFDSWTAFAPLVPVSAVELEFSASTEGPFSVEVAYRYNISTPMSTYDEAHGLLMVCVSNLTLDMRTLVLADQNCLLNVSILQTVSSALVHSVAISNMMHNNSSLLEQEFDRFLGNVFALVLERYGSNIWQVLDLTVFDTVVRKQVNTFIQNMSYCIDLTGAPNREISVLAMIVSFSVWSFMAVILLLLVWYFLRSRHSRPRSFSIGLCQDLPLVVRLLVPLLVIACFAIYNVTAASKSAVLVLRLFGIVTSPLYAIDIKSSVAQAWNAGVYQMVVVLVLFQIIIPYTKLVVILCAWYVPVNRIRIFLWCLTIFDTIGRFQLISVFIMVIYSTAFHISVSADSAEVASFIIVHVDFWLFLAVGVVSGLLNSFVLSITRKFYFEETGHVCAKPSKFLFWSVLAGLLAMLGCLFAGLILTSFVLKIGGLGGYVLSLVGMPRDRCSSILDIGMNLREGWLDPLSAAACCLQAVFFLFVVVFPVVQALLCFATWVWWSSRMFALLEFFTVWASLDVLMVAIASSVFSLSRYAEFMVGNRCNGIDELLVNYAGGSLDSDTCITVSATLEKGMYFLGVACILLLFLSRFILWKRFPFARTDTKLFSESSINYET